MFALSIREKDTVAWRPKNEEVQVQEKVYLDREIHSSWYDSKEFNLVLNSRSVKRRKGVSPLPMLKEKCNPIMTVISMISGSHHLLPSCFLSVWPAAEGNMKGHTCTFTVLWLHACDSYCTCHHVCRLLSCFVTPNSRKSFEKVT